MTPYPTQLTGAAGEYFVAAELSRRGWAASITPKGVQRSDVLAQHLEDETKVVAIQVKTARSGDNFRLGEKLEQGTDASNEWIIFVALREEESTPVEYYIVPRNVISALIFIDHRRWLDTPGRHGQQHKDNPQRNANAGQLQAYRDAWHLLEGSSHDVPYHLPEWFPEGRAKYGLPPGHPGIMV